MLLVTLLIALSSYEVHLLTQLSHMCTLNNGLIWHLSSILLAGTYIVIA